MTILEKNFERRCTAYCRQQKWTWLKYGTSGWPDRLLIVPGGVHVWMELKTGTKVTPLQRKRLDTLVELGADAYVIESFHQFTVIADAAARRGLFGGA